MVSACLDLTTPDAVTAVLAAVEKYKGWQVTRHPENDRATIWAPKKRGGQGHQTVVLSGDPAQAVALTSWLRQRKWPVEAWLRGRTRIPPTPRTLHPSPYPDRWSSDPSVWKFDPHAFLRIQQRSVHAYEVLACVTDPERTEPNRNYPDRRIAYRGDLKVAYKPKLNLIITVMVMDESASTIAGVARQPLVPPQHLLVPSVLGWPASESPAIPAVSTQDTESSEKPLPNKGNKDPKTGITTTGALISFMSDRIVAGQSDQKQLYFLKAEWMKYARAACPASTEGALSQVLTGAKQRGWLTLGGLQGFTKWSITPDYVKEWELAHPRLIATAPTPVETPATEPDDVAGVTAEVIAETVTAPAVPVPSAVKALAERPNIPRQAPPIDLIEDDDAEVLQLLMSPPRPAVVRASGTHPIQWIEAMPDAPPALTVFDAAAVLIGPDRERLRLKPGKFSVLDRVDRDPNDPVQYTIRASPDGKQYWLIAWYEDDTAI